MITTKLNKTKRIIIANAVIRKKGYWYYVDGDGNIIEALQNKGRKKKSPEKQIKVLEEKIKRLKNYDSV